MTKLTEEFKASSDYLNASLRLAVADTRHGFTPDVRRDFAVVKGRARKTARAEAYVAKLEPATARPPRHEDDKKVQMDAAAHPNPMQQKLNQAFTRQMMKM